MLSFEEYHTILSGASVLMLLALIFSITLKNKAANVKVLLMGLPVWFFQLLALLVEIQV
mgnify:CR=1 FL=1